jgi:hypothetical protein
MSLFLGPSPWIESWTWFMRCFNISFHGSQPRDSPLTSNWQEGLLTKLLSQRFLNPPSMREAWRSPFYLCSGSNHFSSPNEVLYHLQIWLHIMGLRFQQVAMYHMEESRTWLAMSILPSSERLEFPHAIILPFNEIISLSKFTSVGSRNLTWMPR